MFKFSLSVRAYNYARRLVNFPHWESWETISPDVMRTLCVKAGEAVLARGRGMKTATELFRAGGLGVVNIYHKLDGCAEIDRLRVWCEYYDTRLHDALN